MSLRNCCDTIRAAVPSPAQGLPDEVFRLTTQLVPMINVDLLIRNQSGDILLTWREDRHFSPGWHIPGGIIRLGESAENRIRQVAAKELLADVQIDKNILAVTEFHYPELPYRSHFISLLYSCTLLSYPQIPAETWRFFRKMPENILEPHRKYARFFLA